MTADERARAVCEDMASGPLVLEEPFDEWVRKRMAAAIRAAVEEERAECARVAEGFAEAGVSPVATRAIATNIRARGGET